MTRLYGFPTLEEVTLKWRIRDAMSAEAEAIEGDESVDVRVYANIIDIDVFLRDNEDASAKLAREELLKDLLPARLFDGWNTAKGWKRSLNEYYGTFDLHAEGIRVVNEVAYRINLSLHSATNPGCEVKKITKTVELYVSDCELLEDDPRP